MNQILLAAARGARVQHADHSPSVYFNTTAWRIHPEDTHYRYGPISRPVYEAAKEPPQDFDGVGGLPVSIHIRLGDWLGYAKATPEHRRMFLLFLAESLAEVGV